MSKRVLCLLAEGFEEIETVTPVDLLRRAGVEVVIAGLTHMQVKGRCGMILTADTLLAQQNPVDFDLLFIPGGPGVGELRDDGRAAVIARAFAAAGKPVAAICAAPLVLKDAGLLEGLRFTAHESVHAELPGVSDERVIRDGNVITSRGAGTALDFALVLVVLMAGEEKAAEITRAIMA